MGRDIRSEEGGQEVTVTTTIPGQEGTAEQPGFLGIYTLEVTAEEAEKMAFAFEKGSVWLTLVPADFVPAPTDGINRETLFE